MKFCWVKSVFDTNPVEDEKPVRELFEYLRDNLSVGEKDGRAVVMGTFRQGGRRITSDMETCTALCLDIDNGITQPDEILGLFHNQLIAYSSYNSTPDAPRFRVFVPLKEPITPDEYRALWLWAEEKTGKVLDGSKKAPNSIFFTPRMEEEEARENHWCIYREGDPLDAKHILSGLVVKERRTNHTAAGAGFEAAAHALLKLDPGRADEYDTWVRVGMACKHADDSSDMLEAWDAWSEQSSKYEPGACDKKWDTFSNETDNPISVATLILWGASDQARLRSKKVDLPEISQKKNLGDPDTDWTPTQIQTFLAAKVLYLEHDLVKDRHGMVYQYDGICWKDCTQEELIAMSFMVAERMNYPPSLARDKGVAARVGNLNFFSGEIDWNRLEQTEVPFLDCVFDIMTGEVRRHRQRDFLDTYIPHTLDLDAECPLWKKVLQYWFGEELGEEEGRALRLQEFFGYLLLPHAMYKKALVCVGKPDSGKTLVQQVISELLGMSSLCSIPLSSMSKPRERAIIQGKRFNYVSDPSQQEFIASEGWKQMVSTGEAIQLDPKHEKPYMYKSIAKHAIFANDIPAVSDDTGAVENRFCNVYFDKSIPKEEQDPELAAKLMSEIPGILVWAIEGARRLTVNSGNFTGCTLSDGYVYGKRSMRNHLLDAVENILEEDPNSECSVKLIHDRYIKESGEDITRIDFGRKLSQANYSIVRKMKDKVREFYVVGYKLR